MSRLIDADALIKQIESPYTEYPIMIQLRRAIKDFIDSAPTIDAVEVVRGEWKVSCKDSICSVCGKDEAEFICGTEDWYGYGLSNFCPNCGARMSKESE